MIHLKNIKQVLIILPFVGCRSCRIDSFLVSWADGKEAPETGITFIGFTGSCFLFRFFCVVNCTWFLALFSFYRAKQLY